MRAKGRGDPQMEKVSFKDSILMHTLQMGVSIRAHHLFQGEVKPEEITLLSIWCLQNGNGSNTKPALTPAVSGFYSDSRGLIFKAHKAGFFD